MTDLVLKDTINAMKTAMITWLIALISLWPQAESALRVFQPYRIVGRGGEAKLRCSYQLPDGTEELRLALYRGLYEKKEICASSFNTSQSNFETQGTVKCRGEISANGVDLTVTGLKGADTDLYFCALEVLFPPPYLFQTGNGTVVYIQEEPDCPEQAEKIIDPEDTSKEAYVLPLILFAYIIIIIIIIAVINNIINMNHRRKAAGVPPIASKNIDCKVGYENFI